MTPVEASAQFMAVANRLPTLYSLDDQMMAILALMDEGEEVDGLETQLALVEAALAQKVEGYVSVIRTLQSLHDARKAEADRLRARAATAERAADWLLNRLLVHLKTTGQERVETSRFTISVRQNPPKVDVQQEPQLSRVEAYESMPGVPPEYVRVITLYKVDKRSILADFKQSGVIPPGVEITRGEKVDIR